MYFFRQNKTLRLCLLFLFLIELAPAVLSAQENRGQIDSIKNAINATRTDSIKINLLNGLSPLYLEIDLDSLLFYSESAKKLSEQINYKRGKADALKNMSHYHQNKGHYNLAIETSLAAMDVYESIHAGDEVADSYLDLAQIHKEIAGQRRTDKYIDMALSYAQTGYDRYKLIADTPGLATSLITKGVLFRDKSITTEIPAYYDSAFNSYQSALILLQKTGKGKGMLSRLYNNMSQVYTEHFKDYKGALDYLFKAVELNLANDKKSSLSHNYGNISNVYIKLKDHENALKYGRAMLALALQLNRPERVQNSLYQLFQVYRAVHRWDSAHDYYVMADGLNDSLTDAYKTKQVMELQTKYETGKKEAAIKQLNIESEHTNKRIILLAVALGVVAMLAIGLIWLYRRIRRQKQKITQQSNELEVVMKELHHRVKNNLQIVSSLLNLQSYKLEDEAAIMVLKESQLRIQAMSLIHQRLYKTDALTDVNIKDYVTDLAETLMSAYGYNYGNFDLQLNITKEIVDVDKALPIGLIINELVTNAMKYAYKNVEKPLLYIAMEESGSEIVITVKDNGPGIDESKWNGKTDSFGKQLITALLKQLRAKQVLSTEDGTSFTITIPNKEKQHNPIQ